jgi:serine/threonine protein kinase
MFIDKGTYGCVYKPSFKCDTKQKNSKTVSKVFQENKYYHEEIELEKIKKTIDPKSEFTVKKIDDCIINIPQEVQETCDVSSKKSGQIIYEYGGIPLSKYIDQNYDIKTLLPGILNLAKGLKKLKQKKYCHRDLKADNILVKNDNLYIIDFGLMIPYSHVYNDNQDYVLRHNYLYYPPEFKIYYNSKMLNNRLSVISDLDKFVLNDVQMNYIHSSVVFFEENQIQNTIRELLNMFDKNKLMRKTFVQIADKIDVFSFGILLKQIIKNSNSKNKHLNDRLCALATECVNPNPLLRKNIEYICDRIIELIGV